MDHIIQSALAINARFDSTCTHHKGPLLRCCRMMACTMPHPAQATNADCRDTRPATISNLGTIFLPRTRFASPQTHIQHSSQCTTATISYSLENVPHPVQRHHQKVHSFTPGTDQKTTSRHCILFHKEYEYSRVTLRQSY